MKTNPYTGKSYECKCDYSYTCTDCHEVREEYARRARVQSRQDWIVDTLLKICAHLKLDVPPPP